MVLRRASPWPSPSVGSCWRCRMFVMSFSSFPVVRAPRRTTWRRTLRRLVAPEEADGAQAGIALAVAIRRKLLEVQDVRHVVLLLSGREGTTSDDVAANVAAASGTRRCCRCSGGHRP